tara:strand:- start:49 stop:345 length:297 start_codon:yes stop_codon:yes gene_type:complete
MVDAIKNSVNRLDLTKARSSETRAAPAGANRTAAPAASDNVKVSDAASSKVVAQMAEAPPMNSEAVRRIKDAIARGEYPINVDRISEALMDAYREMKS